MENEIKFSQLSIEKQREFEKLTGEYSNILQLIYLFIETNNLDNDEAWDIANQRYDSDMSYAPKED